MVKTVGRLWLRFMIMAGNNLWARFVIMIVIVIVIIGMPADMEIDSVLIRTHSKEAQTWGGGRVQVSDKDRSEIKRARKEGRLAEAMLDRRAAMKR